MVLVLPLLSLQVKVKVVAVVMMPEFSSSPFFLLLENPFVPVTVQLLTFSADQDNRLEAPLRTRPGVAVSDNTAFTGVGQRLSLGVVAQHEPEQSYVPKSYILQLLGAEAQFAPKSSEHSLGCLHTSEAGSYIIPLGHDPEVGSAPDTHAPPLFNTYPAWHVPPVPGRIGGAQTPPSKDCPGGQGLAEALPLTLKGIFILLLRLLEL